MIPRTHLEILLWFWLDYRKEVNVAHAYVKAQVPGDLSSIQWVESPLQYQGSAREDYGLCSVYYAALNFRDVMVATGKLSRDALPCKVTNPKSSTQCHYRSHLYLLNNVE